MWWGRGRVKRQKFCDPRVLGAARGGEGSCWVPWRICWMPRGWGCRVLRGVFWVPWWGVCRAPLGMCVPGARGCAPAILGGGPPAGAPRRVNELSVPAAAGGLEVLSLVFSPSGVTTTT